ncbi:tetratricopeptide repeat protein, partial [bacterium]
ELLCGLFFFLAYYLYLGNTRISKTLAIVCMTIAVFSKEMAAALPLVLIAHEVYYSDREIPIVSTIVKGIRKTIPFIVVAALPLLLKYAVLKNQQGSAGYPGDTPWESIVIMSGVFLKYCRLVLLPLRQCADYVVGAEHAVAAPAGLLLFIVLAVYLRKFGKTGGFTLAFFLLSLLPVSNIIPFGETMAERYLYIPMFALSLGLATVADRWSAKRIAIIPAVAILIFLTVLTTNRLWVWKSDYDLWGDTTICAPSSAEAWMNLGNAYLKRDDPSKALEMYARVPDCETEYEEAKHHYNIGLALVRLGDSENALDSFLVSIEADSQFLQSYYHAGSILGAMGEAEKGLRYLERAIEVNGEVALSHYIAANYAMRYFVDPERNGKAVAWLERAVKLDPASGLYLGALGQAYFRIGKIKQAEDALLGSIETDPDLVPSYMMLIDIYSATGRTDRALVIQHRLKVRTEESK